MPDTLRLKTPMMHGPAVKRLQEMGDLLGFDTGDNDGVFGPNTEKAVRALQKKLKLKEDGVCGPKTWEALLAAVEGLSDEPSLVASGLIYDRRGLHPSPKLYGHKRSWADIGGVTIHQTGCHMSLKPQGWDRLNAHIGITAEGKVIIANDPTDMIWHAQQLSAATIGVEISGNYHGVEGKPASLWKGGGEGSVLSGDMLAGLDTAFDWIKAQFDANGVPWKYVHAHRQSSSSRTSDPGSDIWQKVGMVWIDKLGASDGGPQWKVGSGRPIPKLWNAAYDGDFW